MICLWAALIPGTGDTAGFGQGGSLLIYQGEFLRIQPCQTLGIPPTRMQELQFQLRRTRGGSKWQCDSPKKKKNKERWPWTAGCQPIKPSTINKPGFILLLKILISTEGEVKKWFTPKFSFPTASPRVVFQTSHTSSGYGGILPGMGDQDFGDRAGNKGVPHQKGRACWCQTLPGCGTSRGGRCCRTAGRACRDKSRGSQQHSHWKQGKKVNLVDFSSPSAIM